VLVDLCLPALQLWSFYPTPKWLHPHAPVNLCPSPTLAYPTQNRCPISINNTPYAQFAKAKPLWLNFCFLAQNVPSLCLTQLPPSRPSTPAYPALNRSPLLMITTSVLNLKAEPLWLTFLFSLYFWSIALFSTIHMLIFVPVYILHPINTCIYIIIVSKCSQIPAKKTCSLRNSVIIHYIGMSSA
jgi:hypothetical protein